MSDAGRAKEIRKSDARAQRQQSTVLVATLRTVLTNRLTGTTEATATTATNTEILRPPAPAGQPPSRAHPKANLLAIPIRPRSGDPFLTSHFTCTITLSRGLQPPQLTPLRSTNGSTKKNR